MTARTRAAWAFVGIAAVGAVTVGVAVTRFDPVRPGQDLLTVATSDRVVADSTAPFDRGGAVFAVRRGGLVCFFLDDASGDALVFPKGYAASQDLHLRDPDRRDVASPGSAVGIAFGPAEVEAPAACGADRAARAVVRIHGLRG